jgi:hypothetical protein
VLRRSGRPVFVSYFNEWDFIGVYDPEINVDEYDCLIAPLHAMLAGGADPADISRYLHREIEGHFGMTSTYLGVQPFSTRLHAWWHHQPVHDRRQPPTGDPPTKPAGI